MTARDRVIAAARRHPLPTPELAAALRDYDLECDGATRCRCGHTRAAHVHADCIVCEGCYGFAPLVERKP